MSDDVEGRVPVGSVDFRLHGAIGWITVNNPAKRNAVSLHMWRQLDEVLLALSDKVRCVVLCGAGEEAFVSGADISEFAGRRRSPEDVIAYDKTADGALARLQQLPQPTIAMIAGYCLGGGVALALSCDIRIAHEKSRFGIPAARLGVGYGALGLKKLLDAVSVPVAMDIMISGRRFDAMEAYQMGVVNKVCSDSKFLSEVQMYAEGVAQNAPLTLRAVKQTIKELAKLNPATDLKLCEQMTAACFASDDYLEGAKAFLEKREPHFLGR